MSDYRWIKYIYEDLNQYFYIGRGKFELNMFKNGRQMFFGRVKIIINAQNQSKDCLVCKQWPIDYNSFMRKSNQFALCCHCCHLFLCIFLLFWNLFTSLWICWNDQHLTDWLTANWADRLPLIRKSQFSKSRAYILCNLCKLLPIRRRLSTKFTLNK